MTWVRELGRTPARVVAIDACYSDDTSIVAYAGGKALWHLVDDEWQAVHSFVSGRIELVRCAPSGEVIAGTSTGDVIAGFGQSCRTIARVGPIHSAIRYGDAIYFADRDRVYRVIDGEATFEICFTPKIASVGSWPSTGRLAVGRGKLWLAGSHGVAWTENGLDWTRLPLASSKD